MSSNALVERREEATSGVITKPQTIGTVQASQRVEAEARAALMVAKSCRRDEVDAIDRIKNACQRVRVAEMAEYSYSRGGTPINGPTIKLLEVVAGAWGNIQSGFRELSRQNGESVVEAFAWDLETNNKKVVEFTVAHRRDTRGGGKALTEERDIYELIANMAQRRIRKCLEGVIPRDVVDEAVDECRRTMEAECELTPERIKGMVDKFGKEFDVTCEQIEKRIQRRVDSITPAQFLAMMRVFNSLKDGMSKPEDWFPKEAPSGEEAPTPTTLKEKLKSKPKPKSDDELFEASQREPGED